MGDFELSPYVRALPDVFRYSLCRDDNSTCEEKMYGKKEERKSECRKNDRKKNEEEEEEKEDVKELDGWMKKDEWLNEWKSSNNKTGEHSLCNSSSSSNKQKSLSSFQSFSSSSLSFLPPTDCSSCPLSYTQTIHADQSFIPPSLTPTLNKWLKKPVPIPSRGYSSALEGGKFSDDLFNSEEVSEGGWVRRDVCLVLACDGLYDVLDEQQVAELCCPWMTGDRDERVKVWDDPVFDDDDDGEEEEEREKGKKNSGEEEEEERSESDGSKDDDNKVDGVKEKIEESFEDGKASNKLFHHKKSTCSFSSSFSSFYPRRPCPVITKGRLAELAALRLRSAADALDSADNVSVIVVML
jgi:hypothetical protein